MRRCNQTVPRARYWLAVGATNRSRQRNAGVCALFGRKPNAQALPLLLARARPMPPPACRSPGSARTRANATDWAASHRRLRGSPLESRDSASQVSLPPWMRQRPGRSGPSERTALIALAPQLRTAEVGVERAGRQPRSASALAACGIAAAHRAQLMHVRRARRRRRAAELADHPLELGDARRRAPASRRRPGRAGGSSRCRAPRPGARRRAPGGRARRRRSSSAARRARRRCWRRSWRRARSRSGRAASRPSRSSRCPARSGGACRSRSRCRRA